MTEVMDKDQRSIQESEEISELVGKCGTGNKQAIRDFFDRFAEDIYNFPIKVFHLDADAASDFFLYAFERLRDGQRFRSFRGRSSFRTWFYTVLRNLLIDWMRTIREVQTVSLNGGASGDTRMIENAPDPRSMKNVLYKNLLDSFWQGLHELGIELRVIFKLSYIYYLDLSEDELRFLADRSGKTPEEIQKFLVDLKNDLADKEIKNLGSEDKITSLYISILELKGKKEKLMLKTGQEQLPQMTGTDSYELEKIERSIEKKYQQRERLLEKKEKGHFIVRTPYKYITGLLDIAEGSVSVQMMRAVEKLRERGNLSGN